MKEEIIKQDISIATPAGEAFFRQVRERLKFNSKIAAITAAIERGEIDADELIEKYNLAGNLLYK